ncbi:unannotated protein [freshwater metagenome]|uniref:Unannotated protein n=1 Tax=freshwater metagenome TaxID=449393 RepID=A0A6J7HM00_9ZZZZ
MLKDVHSGEELVEMRCDHVLERHESLVTDEDKSGK